MPDKSDPVVNTSTGQWQKTNVKVETSMGTPHGGKSSKMDNSDYDWQWTPNTAGAPPPGPSPDGGDWKSGAGQGNQAGGNKK